MCSDPVFQLGSGAGDAPVTVDLSDGDAVVRVRGDLDLSTHELLLDCLALGLALAESQLVVDLRGCGFVGARPFRAIEDAADFLHARGSSLFVQEPPPSFSIISAFLGDTCAFRVEGARQPGPV